MLLSKCCHRDGTKYLCDNTRIEVKKLCACIRVHNEHIGARPAVLNVELTLIAIWLSRHVQDDFDELIESIGFRAGNGLIGLEQVGHSLYFVLGEVELEILPNVSPQHSLH